MTNNPTPTTDKTPMVYDPDDQEFTVVLVCTLTAADAGSAVDEWRDWMLSDPEPEIHEGVRTVTVAPRTGMSDTEALDRLNRLLSAPEWPGASGMEDVCEIVRWTGREEIPDAPEWESH